MIAQIKVSQELGPEGVAPSKTYRNINGAFLGVGITQVMLGILTIIFQFVATYANDRRGPEYVHLMFLPIGIFYIVAGGIAVGAHRKQGDKCLVLTTLVLSVIASLVACVHISTRVTFGLAFGDDYTDHFTWVLISIGILELLFSITQAALCCRGINCYQEGPVVIYRSFNGSQAVDPLAGHNGSQIVDPPARQSTLNKTDIDAVHTTNQEQQFSDEPPAYTSVVKLNQSEKGSVLAA